MHKDVKIYNLNFFFGEIQIEDQPFGQDTLYNDGSLQGALAQEQFSEVVT